MSETPLYGPLEGDNARALMHQCISAYMHTVSLQTDSMYFSGYIHDDDWFLRLVLAQTSTYMALNTCVCSYKNVGAKISSFFLVIMCLSLTIHKLTYPVAMAILFAAVWGSRMVLRAPAMSGSALRAPEQVKPWEV